MTARNPATGLTSSQAKAKIIEWVAKGKSVQEACRLAGRSLRTHDYYRTTDRDYAAKIDRARLNYKGEFKRPDMPSFVEFRRKYLHTETFWHQMQWIDVLEGREPRELHPSQTYLKGWPNYVVINTPPEHAKTTTITIDWLTYKLVSNPDERILIVSQSLEMAKKFLRAIKHRLTHPRYKEMHADFGPPEGWEKASDTWTTDTIVFGAEGRDTDQRTADPNLQALGMGGHIYGSRATIIVMDDIVTLKNAHEYEKQLEWIQQEVITRVGDYGLLADVGTRVAPMDIHSELMNPERYPEGESPWTYLSQPAVLAFADDPQDWITLWPYSDHPSAPGQEGIEMPDGELLFPRWDGPAMRRRRSILQPRTWAMVYMQQQVADDAVFPADAVRAAINGQRLNGPMVAGAVGHRKAGMGGLYVIAGLDPAAVGYTAIVVVGLDREQRKRYVLQVINVPGMTPGQLFDKIKETTVAFAVQEWRIEKNAYQASIIRDERITGFLRDRGVIISPHFTGEGKWDPDFGVASMASLFAGFETNEQLIELPSVKQGEGPKALVEQLMVWAPGMSKVNKTDCVMALWFAEIRVRELAEQVYTQNFMSNRYLSKRERERQVVIDLDQAFATVA